MEVKYLRELEAGTQTSSVSLEDTNKSGEMISPHISSVSCVHNANFTAAWQVEHTSFIYSDFSSA